MTPSLAKPSTAVIVGLGRTGLSAARYLRARGWRLAVTDTRRDPPELGRLKALDPGIPVRLGGLDVTLLEDASCIVVSPGVALDEPFLQEARRRGLEIGGDIELFALAVDAPVVGITGTNGKSTVTTLVGRMAQRAGVKTRTGGNLGDPALDLISAQEGACERVQLYVLELSSFQLESTRSLGLRVAAVLNVSPDHLDRYASIEAYAAAKARIFAKCDIAVVNRDDARVAAMPRPGQPTLGFSLSMQSGAEYALAPARDGAAGAGPSRAEGWLTRRGEPLVALGELKIRGLHNVQNALAALAIGEALGLPLTSMLTELRDFPGLPHRTEWVADVRGVAYINDSKGTNVGATIAAVGGLSGPLVIILGGDGKHQDFAPLAVVFRGKVRHAVLIGRDREVIARALGTVTTLERCDSLVEAVHAAARAARPGDTVLLSPACASFDMFRDYAQRGSVFCETVRELAA